MQKIYVYEKILTPGGCLPLPWGYIHVYDHSIQTKRATMAINSKKTFKIIFSRTRRPMILKFGMKHQAMELYKVYLNHDPGITLAYFT